MKRISISEFKPTIFFLVKFIGIYVVANLIYGAFVTAYSPGPDPFTKGVTVHTNAALQVCGWKTTFQDNTTKPTSELIFENKRILAIYEGCNGVNVMIIFVAFLIAFGPVTRTLFWFIPLGLAILHLMNLIRIALLFWVAIYLPDFMYFTHKYLFTAILYVVVFLLWVVWVRKFAKVKPEPSR
ncbi:MAG: exosortase family protein XrtF [Marivirga sp.]|nr:exosortase family protein XrtF [Marivirga sp.]